MITIGKEENNSQHRIVHGGFVPSWADFLWGLSCYQIGWLPFQQMLGFSEREFHSGVVWIFILMPPRFLQGSGQRACSCVQWKPHKRLIQQRMAINIYHCNSIKVNGVSKQEAGTSQAPQVMVGREQIPGWSSRLQKHLAGLALHVAFGKWELLPVGKAGVDSVSWFA